MGMNRMERNAMRAATEEIEKLIAENARLKKELTNAKRAKTLAERKASKMSVGS